MADESLFVAEGRLSEVDVTLLAEELGPGAVKGGQADLSLPFRNPSYFSIGSPVAVPVPEMPGMSAELRHQFEDYEFHQVLLACSFQAAPSCRFTDARFAVSLITKAEVPERGQVPMPDAVAYDIFPQLIEDSRTVKITTAIKPEISFGYEPMTATLSLPSRERVEEQIRYTSRVVAFDLQGTKPAWSFQRTDQHEISGPQRLFLLVRKPRSSTVTATFSLQARVEFIFAGHRFAPSELVMLFRRRDQSGALTDEPATPLC